MRAIHIGKERTPKANGSKALNLNCALNVTNRMWPFSVCAAIFQEIDKSKFIIGSMRFHLLGFQLDSSQFLQTFLRRMYSARPGSELSVTAALINVNLFVFPNNKTLMA